MAEYFPDSPHIHHSTWPHIPDNYRLKTMTVPELKKHKVTQREWQILQNEVCLCMYYINIHEKGKRGKLEWETKHA